jgi:hypothetical protein|eukprot:COSAG06_NODE_135_length_22418_cov_9.162104_10_plen_560_part_00
MLVVVAAVWLALFDLIRAWVELFAPFVADLIGMAVSVWGVVPLRYKVQAAVLVVFGYLLLRMYRAAMKKVADAAETMAAGMETVAGARTRAEASLKQKKKVLVDMLKHAAALPTGYAVFFGCSFVPLEYQPMLVWLLLSVVPTVVSARCFRRYAAAEDEIDKLLAAMGCGGDDEDEDEDDDDDDDDDDTAALRFTPMGSPGTRMSRRRQQAEYHPSVLAARRAKHTHVKEAKVWLSYWTCWPLLILVNDSVVLRYTSSYEELPRLAIVLLVWLQAWHGSIHLRKLLRVAFRGMQTRVTAMLPGGRVPDWLSVGFSVGRPGFGTLAGMGSKVQSIFSFVSWAAKNKVIAGCMAGVALIFVYRALFFVGSLLTTAIVWGAAVDTARIVSASKFEGHYRPRLSFWILSRALEWLCMVPVAGTLLLLWYPVLLALLLAFGEPVLRFLCRRMEPRQDPMVEELKNCWRSIAGAGDEHRKMSRADLRRVYASMDNSLSPAEIDAAVEEIDVDGDGMITFEDFSSCYLRCVCACARAWVRCAIHIEAARADLSAIIACHTASELNN